MLISGFNTAKGDRITPQGYGADELQQALAAAGPTPGGYTIRLSDNTRIAFSDVSKLDASALRVRMGRTHQIHPRFLNQNSGSTALATITASP